MTRLLSTILVALLLTVSAGCGNFFVRGAVRTGSTLQGSVSSVQLGSVLNGTGETIQVTTVTFLENGVPFTIGFCADEIDLFPLDQTVLVDFNPGLTCADVILVVIVS